ncbi:hypothetical protein SCLCIDRAFT_792184 [Scleroderma citrinum Foug A]|uniref:Uncharacterized protein n=1 Tax=Scleroderma citrinum Foug A TaxID=1036808 RepID=A0A0C3E2P5_9AGAM|nr:hypothetical protein SCLCIDRAFT_792184 [Scleroderma citrinum Foug A]
MNVCTTRHARGSKLYAHGYSPKCSCDIQFCRSHYHSGRTEVQSFCEKSPFKGLHVLGQDKHTECKGVCWSGTPAQANIICQGGLQSPQVHKFYPLD